MHADELPHARLMWPMNWVNARFGHDYAAPVVAVQLGNTAVRDRDLACLTKFDGLHALWLNNTAITDEGLRLLQSCRHLEELSLRGTGGWRRRPGISGAIEDPGFKEQPGSIRNSPRPTKTWPPLAPWTSNGARPCLRAARPPISIPTSRGIGGCWRMCFGKWIQSRGPPISTCWPGPMPPPAKSRKRRHFVKDRRAQ